MILKSANALSLDKAKNLMFDKRLTYFQKSLCFLCVCSTNLWKTLREKEKLLAMSDFSFPCSAFYPFGELFAIFVQLKIVDSKSLSLEESLICPLAKC